MVTYFTLVSWYVVGNMLEVVYLANIVWIWSQQWLVNMLEIGHTKPAQNENTKEIRNHLYNNLADSISPEFCVSNVSPNSFYYFKVYNQ